MTTILGEIKAQLPFSEGKYQLLNSWNKILFPTNFYHLNFHLPHPNRSNDVSSHRYPFKRPKNVMRKHKLHSKPCSYFFSLGAPVVFP